MALFVLMCQTAPAQTPDAPGTAGYYRFPAIHGDSVVFTAEGDLWKTTIHGGVAQRLTTHPGNETRASFSPDGKTLAFLAEYEGSAEVFTMPSDGGLPTRRTYEGGRAEPVGWTPDGKLIYTTSEPWNFPDAQTATLNLATGATTLIPVIQASQGVFDSTGQTFFFTRLPYNRLSVKRYKGGTAENLWKYSSNEPEAKPLTADYPGTSRAAMWWNGRLYFVTDRDGAFNLWSMNPDGGDLRQHTRHKAWDVKRPALSDGHIIYQLGADLRIYDIAANADAALSIQLASDFEHEREKWIKKPLDYVTAAHLSPSGDRVALTARGQVFVAPAAPGRFVEVTRQARVRYRYARFLPDGKSLAALSDESGEVEFTKLPANGVGNAEPLTKDGKVLRDDSEPSPDGKWLAWPDKNQQLWLLDIEKKETKLVEESKNDGFYGLAWSPDSRWLAYAAAADNLYHQIWLYNLKDGSKSALTSDRVESHNPAWSPDGKWIYFLSERHLESLVGSPWGLRQPEPFFDKLAKIYLTALTPGLRSPFEPGDELHPGGKDKDGKDAKKTDATETDSKSDEKKETSKAGKSEGSSTNKAVEVTIDVAGLAARTWEVPVPSGNYSDLSVNDKRLFWISRDTGRDAKSHLQTLDIANEDPKPKNFTEDVRSYEISLDGKKLLIRKGDVFHVEDAGASPPAKLEKSVNLENWSFPINPRDEWRQMFVEAWRLERDYFYDRKMHGLDWPAILKKYLPTADRVTDRAELSDLISDMVSELSALHIRVTGGDIREGQDKIMPASLGASLLRDEPSGGWRIDHIYRTDPDYPDKLSPLARPGVDVKDGDVIVSINGVPTLSAPHPRALLRNEAGKQVLLGIKSSGDTKSREVIVKPIEPSQDSDLRYSEWEYTRRQRVEQAGRGELGYIHLRAMGQTDIAQWTRDYYPVYNRKGLIIDVRHNRGGNIDSWILEKLLRKAWFYWQPRVGAPTWNMQYAFRGHVAVLCDEFTASDGEAFSEGIKRLRIGKVIGKRTWGGEIWLSANNFLVDHGIATAAETGVYGPEGQWLIEGHGVDPDIVIDNPPHATFQGEDAQLAKAIEYLQDEIRRNPIPDPAAPPYPDKSEK